MPRLRIQFRLHSMLLVILVVSVPLGWVAHLRSRAMWHRLETNHYAMLVQRRTGYTIYQAEYEASFVAWRSEAPDDLKKLAHHRALARRYHAALYFPWILRQESKFDW